MRILVFFWAYSIEYRKYTENIHCHPRIDTLQCEIDWKNLARTNDQFELLEARSDTENI